jgi:nucleoid-associated protein YejK
MRTIIHEIKKNSGAIDNVVTTLSDVLIDQNENSENLVNLLRNSFNNDDRLSYAKFNIAPDRYFPTRFNDYFSSDLSDAEFIQFTVDATNNLETIINRIVGAKGGYLVFTEYDSVGYNFTSIFLVRDTEGITFNRTARTYSIEKIDYLNTDKLAMACKINHNKYDEATEKFLTFTKHRQQTVSDYFYDWIASDQTENSAEYTRALLQIVNNIDLPANRETGEILTVNEFRDRVSEFISTRDGLVNLIDLSNHFYDEPNKIIDYARENDYVIDSTFKTHSREMQKFKNIYINRDGINLKAARGDMGVKIRLGDNPDIVIIESSQFATAVRNAINGN